MHRILLALLAVAMLFTLGCAGHSNRHTNNKGRIAMCSSLPCGAEVVGSDMIVNFNIVQLPTNEFILSGTMTPRGIPAGTKVDFAQLSFELTRDVTVFDDFSFPIVGKNLRTPIPFKYTFKPSGGFDGIMFNWDVHYLQ